MESYDHHQRQVSPPPPSNASDEIRNMHDVLSDPYRCAILYCLQSSDQPVAVSEVESKIDEWSTEIDDFEIESTDDLRTWLLENHILQLDGFGTIQYDPGRDVVQLAEDVAISVTAPWQE